MIKTTSDTNKKVFSRYKGDRNGVIEFFDEQNVLYCIKLNNSKETKYYVGIDCFKKLFSFSRPRYKKDYNG